MNSGFSFITLGETGKPSSEILCLLGQGFTANRRKKGRETKEILVEAKIASHSQFSAQKF